MATEQSSPRPAIAARRARPRAGSITLTLTLVSSAVAATAEAPPAGAPGPPSSSYVCEGGSTAAATPVIQRLREAQEAGDRDAVARLVECLSQLETPVIEPATTPGSQTVTFPFVAEAGVVAVRLDSLVSAVLIDGIEEDFDSLGWLERIGESDLWLLSMELPKSLRAHYRFQLSRSDGSTDRVLDPRNPRVYEEHWTPNFRKSELVLEEAPAQPWRSRLRREGSWESHQVGGREVWVYAPAVVESGERAPGALIVALGTMTFHNILPTGRLIDHLVAEGSLEPPLVLSVDPAEGSEAQGYSPEADYVAGVLLPWARSRYGLSPDPKDVVVTGSSIRGLMAILVAFQRPDAIGKALSLSGSFYWSPDGNPEAEWLTGRLAKEDRREVQLYLVAGTLETVATHRNRGLHLLATNRHLRDVLVAKEYLHVYREIVGVHDEITWQSALASGLVTLLSE